MSTDDSACSYTHQRQQEQYERMRTAEITEQRTNRLERERERYAQRAAIADERDRRLARRRLQWRNQSRDGARDEVFANSQNGNSDMLASPSVQKKMKEFHTKMSELQFVHCTTCHKSFPSLCLADSSTECVHCSHDIVVPKLYSSDNNMDCR